MDELYKLELEVKISKSIPGDIISELIKEDVCTLATDRRSDYWLICPEDYWSPRAIKFVGWAQTIDTTLRTMAELDGYKFHEVTVNRDIDHDQIKEWLSEYELLTRAIAEDVFDEELVKTVWYFEGNTIVKFWFKDPKIAMLFKLTFAGGKI